MNSRSKGISDLVGHYLSKDAENQEAQEDDVSKYLMAVDEEDFAHLPESRQDQIICAAKDKEVPISKPIEQVFGATEPQMIAPMPPQIQNYPVPEEYTSFDVTNLQRLKQQAQQEKE